MRKGFKAIAACLACATTIWASEINGVSMEGLIDKVSLAFHVNRFTLEGQVWLPIS